MVKWFSLSSDHNVSCSNLAHCHLRVFEQDTLPRLTVVSIGIVATLKENFVIKHTTYALVEDGLSLGQFEDDLRAAAAKT